MFQRMVWIVLVGLFLNAQAAEVVSVTLSLGVSDNLVPIQPGDHFSTRAPALHALAELENVTAPTEVEGSWIAIDAITTPNYVIDSVVVSLNPGATHAHFSLSKPTSDWPAGNYELAISVNGTLVGKAPFVVSDSAPVPAAASIGGQLTTPPFATPAQSSPSISAAAPAPAQTIVGNWQCQMSFNGSVMGKGVMAFDANNRVTFNQSTFAYQLISANQLRLQDQVSQHDYEYQLAGNALKMRYGDGSTFDCVRGQQMAGAMGQPQAQGGMMGGQSQGGGAANWQLRGTFCSFSGSSSYSSTGYLNFDGQGRWSQSSESSFSNQHGSGYGQSGNTGGSYQVSGKIVQYQSDAGEQGTAEVHMQQNNGQITEIMIGRQLYAMGMCG